VHLPDRVTEPPISQRQKDIQARRRAGSRENDPQGQLSSGDDEYRGEANNKRRSRPKSKAKEKQKEKEEVTEAPMSPAESKEEVIEAAQEGSPKEDHAVEVEAEGVGEEEDDDDADAEQAAAEEADAAAERNVDEEKDEVDVE
jgi:hypothetical protein